MNYMNEIIYLTWKLHHHRLLFTQDQKHDDGNCEDEVILKCDIRKRLATRTTNPFIRNEFVVQTK